MSEHLWERTLRISPEAWDDFRQWVAKRRETGREELLTTDSWDATLACRAKVAVWDELLRLIDREEREERAKARRIT